MNLRHRLAALERRCVRRPAPGAGPPPRPAVERARSVCDAFVRDPGAAPPGFDVAAVRATLGAPGAEQAAEAFLAQCVSLQCAAALDVEIENELCRLGPGAERFVEEFLRAEGL